jgi:hypothetical protein
MRCCMRRGPGLRRREAGVENSAGVTACSAAAPTLIRERIRVSRKEGGGPDDTFCVEIKWVQHVGFQPDWDNSFTFSAIKGALEPHSHPLKAPRS